MSLDVSRELAVVQCGVTAAAFQQFMMVAVLDDVTMFHIQNQVRVTDRRQPVRDDEAGASCHQSCHGFADFRLGPGIDGAGSLVEYQDRRIRKEDAGVHARIMNSLCAAHAELETCLGDVLALEGWDPATLAMPEGLRQLRDDLLS